MSLYCVVSKHWHRGKFNSDYMFQKDLPTLRSRETLLPQSNGGVIIGSLAFKADIDLTCQHPLPAS